MAQLSLSLFWFRSEADQRTTTISRSSVMAPASHEIAGVTVADPGGATHPDGSIISIPVLVCQGGGGALTNHNRGEGAGGRGSTRGRLLTLMAQLSLSFFCFDKAGKMP